MGTGNGFPIDLILFGMIAAFLVLRLRSILGRRQGFERPVERTGEVRQGAADLKLRAPARPATRGPVMEAAAEPAAVRILPDPASPTGQALASMRAADPGFDAARFLGGAEAAFRMIVTAFAAGNREVLHPLLSEETYRAFEAAISGRETAGETQRSEIRAVTNAAVESAGLDAGVATITVRFVSDQISMTLDRNGQPVVGADAVMELVDLWTFERTLNSADPTWRLAAARSA